MPDHFKKAIAEGRQKGFTGDIGDIVSEGVGTRGEGALRYRRISGVAPVLMN